MRLAAKYEAEERLDKWRRAAYIGYQVSALFRKEPLSFGAYLRNLGMAFAPAAPTVDLAVEKERALAIGDDIRKRDPARN